MIETYQVQALVCSWPIFLLNISSHQINEFDAKHASKTIIDHVDLSWNEVVFKPGVLQTPVCDHFFLTAKANFQNITFKCIDYIYSNLRS